MYNVECLICKYYKDNIEGSYKEYCSYKCELNKFYCKGCNDICDYCPDYDVNGCDIDICDIRIVLCQNYFCHFCTKFEKC